MRVNKWAFAVDRFLCISAHFLHKNYFEGTTFCLHFIIKSTISIPPDLPPFRLFILLLLAGDINPNPGPPRCPKVTYANIRSIHKKYPAIAKFISDNDTDLFAMSETWIRPDTTSANLSEITPPGYKLYQQPRAARRGGGLGFFVKDGLDPSVVPTKTCTTFENFLLKITLHKESFYLLNIYRPPSSSTTSFFYQFQSLLEDIHHTTENLVIISDFNFYLETTCSNSKTFHSLIDSFDLTQKVNFSTHIHGHTLDQVLTKSNNDYISNVHTTDAFSDHFSISFILNLSTPTTQTKATVTFRKNHKIDKDKLKTDLLTSELLNNPSKEADTLYEQYHTTLSTLIDKYAPPHTKNTKAKYIPGWRPSICLNVFGAEINLPSIDPNTCRKSTSTIKSACRPNLNSSKKKFGTITTTHKNYGESWVMCYTESQQRFSQL